MNGIRESDFSQAYEKIWNLTNQTEKKQLIGSAKLKKIGSVHNAHYAFEFNKSCTGVLF